MSVPSYAEAARLRAAVARDQAAHWRRLLWEPARTKKQLDKRERLWFWVGQYRLTGRACCQRRDHLSGEELRS
jgi:hypothetical protein